MPRRPQAGLLVIHYPLENLEQPILRFAVAYHHVETPCMVAHEFLECCEIEGTVAQVCFVGDVVEFPFRRGRVESRVWEVGVFFVVFGGVGVVAGSIPGGAGVWRRGHGIESMAVLGAIDWNECRRKECVVGNKLTNKERG